jgi:hypothetical protein
MMRYQWQAKLKHRVRNALRRLRGKRVLPDIYNEKLADDLFTVAIHQNKKRNHVTRYKFTNHQ